MINADTVLIDGCIYNTGVIYDDGGASGDYSDNFDGWVVIQATQGAIISLSGNYVTESPSYDWFDIWDGTPATGTQIVNRAGGTGSFNLTATSGRMTIRFQSDGSSVRSGFALSYSVMGGTVAGGVNSLATSAVSPTSATLTWSGTGSSACRIFLNDILKGTSTSSSFTLSGLNPATRYNVKVVPVGQEDNSCSFGILSFRTACGSVTLPLSDDFDDLPTEAMPPCWIRSTNFDALEYLPQVTSLNNQSTLFNVLMLSSGGNSTAGHYGMVITPVLHSTTEMWDISFDYLTSHPTTTVVQLGTCDSTSPEYQYYGFNPITTIYSGNNNNWEHFHMRINPPADAARFAFRMLQQEQNGEGRMFYIDNLQISACGIEQASTYHTDTTSTMLQWTTFGNPSVEVGVRQYGALVDEQTFPAATSPLTISNLTPGTRYQLILRPTCNVSQNPTVVEFSTPSPVIPDSTLCDYPCYDYELQEGWNYFLPSSGYNVGINYRGIYLYSGTYLVAPPVATLSGMYASFQLSNNTGNYNEIRHLVVGSMSFGDDTNTFTPIDTIDIRNYELRTFVVHYPVSCTDRYVAVRSLTDYPWDNVYVEQVGVHHRAVSGARIAHTFSSRVQLAWDSPRLPGDTVIIEYYSPWYGYYPLYDTVVGVDTTTIFGLNTDCYYSFALFRPGEIPCQYISTQTSRRDFTLPLCEDFESWYSDWSRSVEWNARNGNYSCPMLSSEVAHSSYQSLKMVAWTDYSDYSNTLILPDMVGLAGKTMTFWAYGFATSSVIDVCSLNEQGGTYDYRGDFHRFDSISILGDGSWHLYSIVLPDTLTGRLALRYRLSAGTSGLYYLWIDDLQLGSAGYNYLSFDNLEPHEVDVLWQPTVGTTAIGVKLVGGGRSFVNYGAPDSIHFSGLDSNTLYNCYLAPIAGSDTLCWIYAGAFVTPMYGAGGEAGAAACNPMDDLLTIDYPIGWVFSDSNACAIVLNEGIDSSQALRVDLGTSLSQTSIVLPAFDATALYLAARGLGNADTLFLVGDTLLLDSTWRYFCLEPSHGSNDTLRIVSGSAVGGCLLDNVGFSSCPIIDFTSSGNTIRCRVRGGLMAEYLLTLTAPDGSESSYHIFSNDYTISNLEPSTRYQVRWRCPYLDSGCQPTLSVSTDRIPLPYCVDFRTDSYTSLPRGWRVTVREGVDDLQPQSDFFHFHSGCLWDYNPTSQQYEDICHWQYILFPEVEASDNISVYLRLRDRMYNDNQRIEIGVLTNPDDTSTFIPAASFVGSTKKYELEADLSLLPRGRVAVRNLSGTLQLHQIAILPTPLIRFSLFSPDSLSVVAATPGNYWLGYSVTSDNNSEFSTPDNIVHVADTIFNIPFPSNPYYYDTYLKMQRMADSVTLSCNYPTPIINRFALSLPYCNRFDSWESTKPFFYFYEYDFSRLSHHHEIDNGVDADMAVFSAYNAPTYLIFPYVPQPLNHLSLRFRYRIGNSESTFRLNASMGVLNDALDTSSFFPVDSLSLLADNQWHPVAVSFSDYSGNGHWPTFRVTDNPRYNSVFIDDLEIYNCQAATFATATLERYNVVRIDNPVDETFYVEYGPRGFVPGTGTRLLVDNLPLRLTLVPETTYEFYFLCDNVVPPCATSQIVTTLAEPLSVPVCIDFDSCSAASLPRSWTPVVAISSVTDSVSHSGNSSLVVRGTVATPDINIDTLKHVALGLWVMAIDPDARLIVGTMTNTSNASSFYRIKTIAPRQTGVWEHHFVSFDNAPNNAFFVVLRNSQGNRGTILVDDMHITNCAAFDLHVDHVDNNAINLSWKEVGSPTSMLTVSDDGVESTSLISGGHLTLPITPLHNYRLSMHSYCAGALPCAQSYDDTIQIVGPVEGVGCVNPTDLQSPQAVFYYGSYGNPYAHSGAVDEGYRSADSRHTVCYDSTERDPRTGGLLRTIPEGYNSSVRLGNWSTNMEEPEAEGVIYSLRVDTLSFNLLMLRYAAVLQDPMHDVSDQPRFRLELLDSNMTLIDSVCAAADFIANRSLGWNEAPGNVLWKDWTPVGIDVAAYADQQIYVRLTTYDCNEGSHYGYAYFTLECMRKSIDSETCGAVDSNRFTAPAGFNYRWYTTTSPATIGTSRTLVVPTADMATYLCDLSFVGNSACSFTLSAYGGARLPLALADTVVTISDCKFDVQFINQSTISPDGVNPSPTGEVVETAFWDFGNGQTSNNYHGQTTYDAPGLYTVTLIVGISGGVCTDTLTWPLYIDFPTHPHIVGPSALCYGDTSSLHLIDGTPLGGGSWSLTGDGNHALPLTTNTYQLGSNTYSLAVTDQWGCNASLSHTLKVNPSYTHMDTILTCTPLLPFYYADTVFLDGTVNARYDLVQMTAEGCDSSYHLWLSVSDTNAGTFRDTVVASICDNQYYSFFGTDYNQEGSHISVHLNATGFCDSIHRLELDVRPTSATDTTADVCDIFVWHDIHYYASAQPTYVVDNQYGCDSVTTLTLTVRHSTDTTIYHSVVENDLPYIWNGLIFSNDTTGCMITLPNHVGCDSTILFSLNVWRNLDTTLYAALCEGLLPMMWNGVPFILGEENPATGIITHQATLVGPHGEDSVVTMYLTVLRNTSAVINDTLVENDMVSYTPAAGLPRPTLNDQWPLVTAYDTTVVIANVAGCDSTVRYTLHVWKNYEVYDSLALCADLFPYSWNGLSLNGDTVATVTLTTGQGADSTVTLTLRKKTTYEMYDTIYICPRHAYIYEGVDHGGPCDFDWHYLTVEDCDSLVHVSMRPSDTNYILNPEVKLEVGDWMYYDTLLLGCNPETIHFKDSSIAVTREWKFWHTSGLRDTLTATDSMATFRADTTGVYGFSLVAVSDQGCIDTIVKDSILMVFLRPEADFITYPERLSMHRPDVQTENRSNPIDSCTWLWLFPKDAGASSYDSATAKDAWYSWEAGTDPGEYPVSLIAFWLHEGPDSAIVTCTDTATINIEIVNTYLQFPNLVTPNGDGVNDIWKVVGLLEIGEYSMNELWIYNRWGGEVYHVKNIKEESDFWDPEKTSSPDGTYYYRFMAKNDYGVVKRNGVIEVVR